MFGLLSLFARKPKAPAVQEPRTTEFFPLKREDGDHGDVHMSWTVVTPDAPRRGGTLVLATIRKDGRKHIRCTVCKTGTFQSAAANCVHANALRKHLNTTAHNLI